MLDLPAVVSTVSRWRLLLAGAVAMAPHDGDAAALRHAPGATPFTAPARFVDLP
jgi:hypothetical protein